MDIQHRKYVGMKRHQAVAHWNMDIEDARMAHAWRQEARYLGTVNAGTRDAEIERAKTAMADYRASRRPIRDAINRAARASDLPDEIAGVVAMTSHQQEGFAYSAAAEGLEEGVRALAGI